MGLERFRRTGGVSFEDKKGEKIDEATSQKLKFQKHVKLFSKISGEAKEDIDIDDHLALDIEDISKSGKNSWIAVIHADGNGLGQILQGKGKEISNKKQNRTFSMSIENATKAAVQRAFEDVVLKDKDKWEKPDKFRYPIRPVVLGGDDLTVIIRADLALDFTHQFLNNFEETSKLEFGNLNIDDINGLTACAGIAFVKKSYPLHYALHLAEELCKDAKKKVKKDLKAHELPKSALAFHKVQDSFIEDWEDLKKRTLLSSGWDFYAGPYLLDQIEGLKEKLGKIENEANGGDRKTKAVGKLRQIVSKSYKDVATTELMLKRMKDVNADFYKALQLDNDLESLGKNETSQLLDLITLHSFNYGDKNN
jgi:hypothetical protein